MIVDCYREDSYSFKITNNEDGINAIQIFFNVMDKCEAEAKRKGFKNLFDSHEKTFIVQFNKVLKDATER
jgi:hypothetical protein